MPFTRADRAALLIALGFAIVAFAYALTTPIFEAPDEASHFLYSHNLIEEGRLPILEDRAVMFASGSVQRHHPPLYYLVGALLISGTDRTDLPTYLRLNPLASIGFVGLNNLNVHLHPVIPPPGATPLAALSLRVFSIVLAAGTVLLVYRTGALLFRPRIGLTAALLTACIPQFVFIGSSINNDNLIVFLSAAGVTWCAWVWRRARLRPLDAISAGVILAGIALTKNNGFALFVLIPLVIAGGVLTRRWSWRAALTALLIGTAVVIALAGWWYIRNLDLYGDLFGLQRALSIWARGEIPDLSPGFVLGEARSIYISFWMIFGYFNIAGPSWLYTVTVIIVVGGVVGGLMGGWRALRRRDGQTIFALVLCGLAIAGVGALVVYSSQQISSSQGRIVFPALVAITPLIAFGWDRLIRWRWALAALIAPVAAGVLIGVGMTLPYAYPALTAVDQPDAAARRIDASAEGLRLIAYTIDQPTAAPGTIVSGSVYFSGAQPDDPRLIVRAIDRLTNLPVGGAEFFPGMAPTSSLDPDQVYRAQFRFRLDDPASPVPPGQLGLLIDWRTVSEGDPAQGRYLTWAAGTAPILDGWLRLDADYASPPPAVAQSVDFGGVIRLNGYTLTDDGIMFDWEALTPTADDLRLAFGLLDAAGSVIVQADGVIAGLPSTVWVSGLRMTDRRLIAPEVRAAAAQVYVGWYRADDLARLPNLSDPDGDGLWRIAIGE